MKMSDVFERPVSVKQAGPFDYELENGSGTTLSMYQCEAAVHAINSHDKLTERVKVLEATLTELVEAEWMVSHDWGGDRASVLEQANKALKAGK